MRIGIDCGNSGAISLLTLKLECVTVEDMPLTAHSKGKNQVNPAGLSKLLERWKSLSGEPIIAFVERVNAMPGQGVTSMFSFGMGYGIVQGVLASLKIPYVLVTPQQWKKRAGLIGQDKDRARTIAQQLYPNAPLDRKKDIGRADAILIARFGSTE